MKKNLKEDTKHITKLLKLLKNANYRKKISKCWKKYLQMYRSIQFCIRKEKNKQTEYNTADQ